MIRLIKRRNVIVALLIVFCSFGIVSNANAPGDNYFEISKNLNIFGNLYREVNAYYVDDIDPAKFIRSGIDAMLDGLGDFGSEPAPPAQAQQAEPTEPPVDPTPEPTAPPVDPTPTPEPTEPPVDPTPEPTEPDAGSR